MSINTLCVILFSTLLLLALSFPFIYHVIAREVVRNREWKKIVIGKIYKKWEWPLDNPFYQDSDFRYLRVIDKKGYHVKYSEWGSHESESEDAIINYCTMDAWVQDLKYIEDADF